MNTLNAKPTFHIIDVLQNAWHLVRGHKWPIWAIAIFAGVISVLLQLVIGFIFHVDPQNLSYSYRYLFMPLISSIAVAPFLGGAIMIAILAARGQAVDAKTGFRYLYKAGPVILTLFLITLLASILPFVLHLPWVAIALNSHVGWLNILAKVIALFVYLFSFISLPLIIDKNYSPWQALIGSFQVIKQCWFRTFVLFIIMYALFTLATLPAYMGAMIDPWGRFIGTLVMILISVWVIPFILLIQGVLYHKLID
jgi:hypothetical protein